MGDLVLIRGLPGSGKSTLARTFAGYRHFEADQFFEHDGTYSLDAARLDDAHRACLENTRRALADGCNVVVANTFTRRCEIEPYTALGYPLRVIEARGRFTSVHAVSAEAMAHLARQWERWPAQTGTPPAIEIGDDAVSAWESLVGGDDAIAAIGVFDYAPLPMLQARVRLTAADAQVVEAARGAAAEQQIPFWDALIGGGFRSGALSDVLLDLATLANPPSLAPAWLSREEAVDGKLRGRAQGVARDRVLAICSDARLRSGAIAHFPLLDLRCTASPEGDAIIMRIARRLFEGGGVVLRSSKSYHLVGRVPVSAEQLRRVLAQSLFYAPLVDRMYVAHHLLRGRCTLRISALPMQASGPIVVAIF